MESSGDRYGLFFGKSGSRLLMLASSDLLYYIVSRRPHPGYFDKHNILPISQFSHASWDIAISRSQRFSRITNRGIELDYLPDGLEHEHKVFLQS